MAKLSIMSLLALSFGALAVQAGSSAPCPSSTPVVKVPVHVSSVKAPVSTVKITKTFCSKCEEETPVPVVVETPCSTTPGAVVAPVVTPVSSKAPVPSSAPVVFVSGASTVQGSIVVVSAALVAMGLLVLA
jgi:hypothetical protein